MSGILVAIIALGVIVIIHELGHFLVAKLFRMKVDTFSVGFGPRILGFRYGETDYRVSAFPLGGYVRMEAEDAMSKPRYQRFLVALAGPVMNGVLAIALLAGVFMNGVQVPEQGAATTGVVERIANGSPAQAAGMQAGDNVVRVHGIDVASSGRTVQQIVQDVPEEKLRIGVLRNGQELELEIQPFVENGQRKLGVYFQIPTVLKKFGFVDAVNESVRTNEQYALMVFGALGKLVSGGASLNDVEGPIGLARITGQAANQSVAALVMLMAIISLNLGIINLLPVPMLDGGTMLILLVETLMGRDLSLIVKERIMQAGIVLLLIVFVAVLYNDVVKLAGPSAL